MASHLLLRGGGGKPQQLELSSADCQTDCSTEVRERMQLARSVLLTKNIECIFTQITLKHPNFIRKQRAIVYLLKIHRHISLDMAMLEIIAVATNLIRIPCKQNVFIDCECSLLHG